MLHSLADLLIESAWKGSILLLLGTLASFCLARKSATARRWVWFSTMLGLLLLPAAQVLLRVRGIALPIAVERIQSGSNSVIDEPASDNTDLRSSQQSVFVAEPLNETEMHRRLGLSPADSDFPPVWSAAALLSTGPGKAVPSALAGESSFMLADRLMGMWLVGFALMLVPLVVGVLSLRRLEHTGEDVTSQPLGEIVSGIAVELGIRRPVTTLLTDARAIPMTWGALSPRIILPREALAWSHPRLQMVLLHELTHVRRCDTVTLWIGQLARATHWFNPLAWWGLSRLHAELENSCDDQVLASGTSPADYAEQIIELTAGLPRSGWAASVALAVSRTRRIRRRLEAILDETRNRRALPRRAIHQLVACGLTLALLIGVIEVKAIDRTEDAPTILTDVQSVSQPGPAVEIASTEPSPEVLTAATSGGADSAVADPAPASQVVRPDQPAAGQSDSFSLKAMAEIQALIKARYARPTDKQALTESAISGMLKSLNDPYTEFMPPARLSELQRALDGQLTGIGVQMSLEGGKLTVITALPDSPALAARLRPGDVVLEVDEKSVEVLGQNEALAAIRGKPGTTVKLKLRRATGDEEVIVERKSIAPSSVQGVSISSAGKWQYWLDEEKKIGYIHLTEFNNRTPDAFRASVGALHQAGLKGLILDLRHCPGGLLTAALDVAKSLLPQAVIVTIKGQSEPEQVFQSTGEGSLPQFPLLVLVNEHTASAAEVLSAALRENGRAVLLGTRTYGKGSVQSIFPVGDAGAIRMTTAYFYSPKGKVIDRQPGALVWGVDPNDGMFVPVSIERYEKWMQARKQRGIIDPSKGGNEPARIWTSETVESELADPQLAAALRSLTAKVQDGEFVRVGKSDVELQNQFVLREKLRQLEQQHEEMLKQMQSINKELQAVAP